MSDQVQKPTLSISAADALTTPPRTAATTTDGTFQKMLSAMVMQSFLPGMGEDSGAGSMPMASMMMALLEKMISEQALQNDQASSETRQNGQVGMGDPNVGGGILPGYPDSARPISTAVPSGMPVKGRISQGSHDGHIALDIAVPTGTAIRSTMDGRVVYAGWNNQGYGNLVIVENGPYRTYYAHLSEVPVVVGQDVSYGDMIGLSGSTGNSTGPHLHYEVRKDMVHIDPTQMSLYPDVGSGNYNA